MSYYDVLIELPLVGLFIAFSSFLLFYMKASMYYFKYRLYSQRYGQLMYK